MSTTMPTFHFELGDSEYYMNELRSWSFHKHRVIHRGSEIYSWQSKFASWLEREIGIEPERSYRLDGKPNPEIINSSRTSREEKKPEFLIISCPNWSCQQRLRVSMVDGTVRVKCPRCKNVFEH